MTCSCGNKPDYDFDHDAFFCKVCDVWLDEKCDDVNCEYCKDRPEKPSSKI